MTPFHAVVTVSTETPVREALARALDSGHSRLVVVEPGAEVLVRGVVHTNSLAGLLLSGDPKARLESAAKPAYVVPETKPLDDLLTELRQQRAHMAVVASEYGTPAGIVTIEDIVEEIVGDIAEEKEPSMRAVRRLANGDWLVPGDLSIADAQHFGITLPETNGYVSVGGLVFGQLGREPRRGDSVTVNGHTLKVEAMQGNRIAVLRVRRNDTPKATEREEPGVAG